MAKDLDRRDPEVRETRAMPEEVMVLQVFLHRFREPGNHEVVAVEFLRKFPTREALNSVGKQIYELGPEFLNNEQRKDLLELIEIMNKRVGTGTRVIDDKGTTILRLSGLVKPGMDEIAFKEAIQAEFPTPEDMTIAFKSLAEVERNVDPNNVPVSLQVLKAHLQAVDRFYLEEIHSRIGAGRIAVHAAVHEAARTDEAQKEAEAAQSKAQYQALLTIGEIAPLLNQLSACMKPGDEPLRENIYHALRNIAEITATLETMNIKLPTSVNQIQAQIQNILDTLKEEMTYFKGFLLLFNGEKREKLNAQKTKATTVKKTLDKLDEQTDGRVDNFAELYERTEKKIASLHGKLQEIFRAQRIPLSNTTEQSVNAFAYERSRWDAERARFEHTRKLRNN